jgi:AcrR family transcriptional regulator
MARGARVGTRGSIRPVSLLTPGPTDPSWEQSQLCNSVLHESYDAGMATASQEEKPETRRSSTAVRRRARESAILAATRALFDERGVAEAQIEDIARAVGINRAIVYRHFTGKEELFALALVGYLDELGAALGEAAKSQTTPREQLAAVVSAFVDYGVCHPAFVDCAHSLMRRTGTELFDEISEVAMLRLGRAIASCLAVLRRALEAGVESGEFHVPDAPLLANTLYATGLGGLQLARVGLVIDEASPGVPQVGRIGAEQVKALLLTSALAMAQG